MIQLVLDTNVLVAALRSNRGASYKLLSTLPDGQWQPNISVALALEYEDVLKRTGMVSTFNTDQIDAFLNFIFSRSNLPFSVPRLRPALRDPDDDRILEVAVQCGATIITHNLKDFQAAHHYRVNVRTPAEFLLEWKEKS